LSAKIDSCLRRNDKLAYDPDFGNTVEWEAGFSIGFEVRAMIVLEKYAKYR
jgi:hypothetical protein